MQRHSHLSSVHLLLTIVLAVALSGGSGPVGIADAQTASAVPRTLTVSVGGGQDTIEIGRASCRERV